MFRFAELFLEAVHPAAGLILHLNMEENPVLSNTLDTTKLRDLSGNSNHGDIVGATDAAGKYGRARSFDGSNDEVDVTDSPELSDMGELTVTGWVKRDDVTVDLEMWLCKSGSYRMQMDVSGNWVFQYGTDDAAWAVSFQSQAAVAMDTWTHVCVTYDANGGSDNMVFYINGQETNTKTVTGDILQTTSDLLIGRDLTAGRFWTGDIDEVSIYDRALSPDEVADLADDGSPFIVPGHKVVPGMTLEEADEDLLDKAMLSVYNDGGEFLGHFPVGGEVKLYFRLEGESESTHRWTGMVKKPTVTRALRQREALAVELGDYVYEVMSQRQRYETWRSTDGGTIVKETVEVKCPELDTTQVQTGASPIDLVSNGERVHELAFKVARLVGYQLGGDRLKRVLFFPAGSDDSGLSAGYADVDRLRVGPDDTALANVIRVQGGELTALLSEQATQTAWSNVTETVREQVKLYIPKRRLHSVEVWTDPTRTGSGALLRCRVQADEAGSPTDPADRTKDIAQKELDATFLAVDGYTTFLFPDHILGPGNDYWLIVESDPGAGQDVGVDGSGDLTYRAYYAYPVIEQVEDPDSIADIGRREADVADASILSKDEAKDRAKLEIAKRSLAERVVEFEAHTAATLAARPGQGMVLNLPVEGVDGERFTLHKRTWTFRRNVVRVAMVLVEEERLIEAADVIKAIMDRLAKLERARTFPAGEEIVDLFRYAEETYSYGDVATLTVDVTLGMVWDTDAWDLEVWSN